MAARCSLDASQICMAPFEDQRSSPWREQFFVHTVITSHCCLNSICLWLEILPEEIGSGSPASKTCGDLGRAVVGGADRIHHRG